jgi:hypothetical protein
MDTQTDRTPAVASHTDALVAAHEAEIRKLTMQSAAAINIGIALVMNAYGQSQMTLSPGVIAGFNARHAVESVDNADGTFTVKVVAKQ